jgi:hypothetical protein
LLGLAGDAGAMVTVTAGGEVDVSGVCPPVPAKRVKARRKATKLWAAWDACGDLTKVRLKLRVRAPECGEAIGVLKAKRRKRSRFGALRLPSCNDVAPSAAAIEAAVDAALVGLTDPWGDLDDQRAMVTGVEARLGCSFGWLERRGASAGAGVLGMRPPEFDEYDPATSYCGKGTSRNAIDLTLRGDSNCLNSTCYTHDVCYFERCVQPGCIWTSQSTECDEAMFRRCDDLPGAGGCRGGDGWSATDVAICEIAKGADGLQDAIDQGACNEPPCPEGGCNPDTGMCETTTTSTTTTSSTSTSSVTSTVTVTSTSAPGSTVTSTTIDPLRSLHVSPRFACVKLGEAQQFTAVVDGVPDPTLTWALASGGYGSVDGNGLYTAPPLGFGTSDNIVTAEAAEAPGVSDWANIHVSPCECQWSASIVGPGISWQGAGWYNYFITGAGVINFVFQQDAGPNGEERDGFVTLGLIGEVPEASPTPHRAGFGFVLKNGLR